MKTCCNKDCNQGRDCPERAEQPIFTLETFTDFVWGFLRALGIIFTLMAILWFLGKVH